MTLALPKTGLVNEDAREVVGELFLADIGVPPQLYRDYLGIQVDHIFERNGIVRVF
jgi:hypothetical protein